MSVEKVQKERLEHLIKRYHEGFCAPIETIELLLNERGIYTDRLEALSKHIAKMDEDTWRRAITSPGAIHHVLTYTAEEDEALWKQLRELADET